MTRGGLDGPSAPSHRGSMAHVLIHLPHTSRYIPLAERAGLAVDDAELERQHLALVDDRTAELFAPVTANASLVVAPVSRLVVDVERRRDDALEPAAEVGMGAVYTKGVGNVDLRPNLAAGERERLLRRWYDPHHARLDRFIENLQSGSGACVLIDAHSYPRDPLPTEYLDVERPEVCIGTDKEWTRGIETIVAKHFIESGYTTAIDQPYGGSMVPGIVRRDPQRHRSWANGPFAAMAPCKGFHTVMIEIRRDVYLRPGSHLPGPRFNHLQFTLNTLYERLNRVNFWTGKDP